MLLLSLSSTSWIVTYHVFIAGFAFPDSLNDCMSIVFLVTQKIQTTQKTMHNQTLQKWATLSNTVTRYCLSQTLMSNALQYRASKGFSYIYYICRWWLGRGGEGWLRHKFWEIWRGIRANLPLLRGGVLCNISPCEAHPPPPS